MQKQWADAPSFEEFTDEEDFHSTNTDESSGSDALLPPGSGDTMPFLLLHGYWLRDMGFDSGVKIRVEAKEGLVTIRVIGSPRTDPSTETIVFEGEVRYPESDADVFLVPEEEGAP